MARIQLIRTAGAALARTYLLPTYFLGGLVPRRKDLWVFGSWGGQRFADNSAAFFQFCQANLDDRIELVWISHRLDLVRQLRAVGISAYWWWSPAGIFKCLRAGTHLFDCFPKDINFWFSRGATLVNLWSGVPLKSFERDIDSRNSRYYRLFHGSFVERLVLSALMPWHVVKPDFIIATSAEARTIIARAFDIPEQTVGITGLPRNDSLLASAENIGLPETVSSALKDQRQIFVYLPTFRDSGRSFANVEWSQLDELLEQLNACLLIKFHPVDATEVPVSARNVHVLDRALDIYRILPHTAALISDYSSVIWDYLLLQRPVILFVPDLDDFAKTSRSLNFDVRELAIGPICQNFDQLTKAIQQCGSEEQADTEAEAMRVRALARFHEYADTESSRRVLEEIEQRFPGVTVPQSGYLAKLRYRLKYNSWPRLLMNALKRIGIKVLPYYLFHVDISRPSKVTALEGYDFIELTAEHMRGIAELPLVHGDEETFCRRLSHGHRCFSLWQGGEICVLCWMDPECCSFGGEEYALEVDQGYFYDIYTPPSKRGGSLAPLLINACYTEKLRAEGISTILGVVDSMNYSSLSFVRKIGGQAQRKSLYLNFFGLVKKTIVLEVIVDTE